MWKNFHSIFKFPFNQNTIMIYGINDIDTSRCEVQIKVYLAFTVLIQTFLNILKFLVIETILPRNWFSLEAKFWWKSSQATVRVTYLMVYMVENYLDYDGNMDPN